jgi:hypothetical protein
MPRSTLLALLGPIAFSLAGCLAPDSGLELDSPANVDVEGELSDAELDAIPAYELSARPPVHVSIVQEGDVRDPVADADGDGSVTPADCDDTNAAINPSATEADNLTDDDCDGWVDETFVAVGDIVVTEINRQSRFGGAVVVNNGTWVEVYNGSSRTIDMSNWVVARGSAAPYHQIYLDPATAPVLAAGEYAVFCDSNDYEASATSYPLACDYIWGDEAQVATYQGTYHNNVMYLRRDNETFSLYIGGNRTTGTLIDAAAWTTSGAGWPGLPRFSMALNPTSFDATSNDAVDNWCATTESSTGTVTNSTTWRWYDTSSTSNDEHGTPGAANYDCIDAGDVDGDGSPSGTDCDDNDATVYPGATEVCDTIDNDCDTLIDEGLSSAEVEDGLDNDCDDQIDEDFVAVGDLVITEVNRAARVGTSSIVNNASWFEVYNASARTIDMAAFVIGRGLTSPTNEIALDPASAPVLAPGEYAVFCDTNDYEGSAAAFPLTCDYVWGDEAEASSYVGDYHDNTLYLRRDSDQIGIYINGTSTTGTALDELAWYYDATNGYWPRDARFSLSLDPFYVDATDNDAESSWCSTTANASEVVSNNATYAWYDAANDDHGTPGAANYDCPSTGDNDGDGYPSTTDCDDTDATVYPGATETCNSVDDDCDTVVDEGAGTDWYADADGDTYGDAGTSASQCTAPTGYVASSTDCDDAAVAVNPGATETCNSVDDDCDGTVDDGVCSWSGTQTAKAYYDAAVLAGNTDAFRAYGTAASYSVGHSIANNGDFNGDGYDDVVVGQAYHDDGATIDVGRTYMWYGPVDTTDSLTTSDVTITGSTTLASEQYGWASRFAGDVDADGTDDLLASAWRAGSTDIGATYLFLGGSSPTSVTSADATFASASTNDYTGLAIDGGDVTGDGRADVIVSAYGRTSAAGVVAYFEASTIGGTEGLTTSSTVLFTGTTAGDNLGYSGAISPDIDGDGLADIILGAPATASATTPGKAYIFYGVDALSGTVTAASADAVITGGTNADRFGLTVSALGDTDNDGFNDVMITADKQDTAGTDAGAAYIFLAGATGAVAASTADSILTGQAASDFFGRSGAGIGDANGDLYDDIFVGATGFDDGSWSGAGAAYVVYGPIPTGTTGIATAYDTRFTGANSSDAVGYAVTGGGDVNLDGYADFMTSAPSWDGFGYLNSGGSWLYYGRGE